MQEKNKLLLSFCSHEAAKYAVINWHYSKCMPAGKLFKIGVWEDNEFIGVVIFSRGACPNIGKRYNLDQTEIVELTRVALNKHKTTVSKIISIALKILKKKCPGLKLVVSYADINQNHCGTIYQAGNWVYIGKIKDDRWINIAGRIMHRKTAHSKYGTYALPWIRKNVDKNANYIKLKKKHKYLMPLSSEVRKKIIKLSKPYPKKEGSAHVV